MDLSELKAYAERDWSALEVSKREYWAREFATRGVEATLEASRALWLHMRMVCPDWPSDDERREDLAHHIALKRTIDRAAHAVRAVTGR